MLVLLVFVGQAMASAAMPCQMDMQSQPHQMAMDESSNSVHMMHDDLDSSNQASKSDSSGCAELDCSCPMVGCSSAMLPAASFQNKVLPISSHINNQSLLLAINQVSSSLYRPPIFR